MPIQASAATIPSPVESPGRSLGIDTLNLIATATFGLEAVVRRELGDLGIDARISGPGRIAFTGPPARICQANLWLRTADRVLIELARFPATDFDTLFEAVKAIDWQEWIGPEDAFIVRGRSYKSQLSSVPACQRTVKKAMVDKLLAAHRVTVLPETGPARTIEIALRDDIATLTLDTTGPGLNKRGYRPIAGKAPLKETLAAGLVLLSFWRPGRGLIDPFCGTGTIPIEAAMIGRNIAPGLGRSFAAEDWPQLPGGLWDAAREQAADAARGPLEVRMAGFDHHEGALSLARRNARAAGVADDIHFQQRDFAELASSEEYGCVICNPPYGVRIGEHREAVELARQFPLVLRKLPTWSHFILTGLEDFEQIVGREADKRRKLYNGQIECTYYQFHGPRPPREEEDRATGDEALAEDTAQDHPQPSPLPEPHGSPSPPPQGEQAKPPRPREEQAFRPAFGGLPPRAREQADMFANRLLKRAHHLRRWPQRGWPCYRLYDRDIPEIPLAVDWYEGYLHIAEYDRPHDRSPDQHAEWLDLMAQAAASALEVPKGRVFFKRRSRQRGVEQYERFDDRGDLVEVHEAGLTFLVNLSDYLDTGLFLDHRNTREMIRRQAPGRAFLNLFCYTGAFSVYAAAGGAASTTSVDLSRTYLDWAGKNLQANGFAPGETHRLIRADTLTFLRDQAGGRRYDLAVADVPTFSNSKSTEQDWEVQRDHRAMLEALREAMNSGGVVYFSTNFRRFKPDLEGLGFGQVREITRQTIPDDFRNTRIHRCWRLVAE